MPYFTEDDLEAIELGATLSLYSVSLAVTVGAMQNDSEPEMRGKVISLADNLSKDLKNAMVRSGLDHVEVRLASSFQDASELSSYLFSTDFAKEINSYVVRHGGKRQEAVFQFALKLTEAQAAIQYGHHKVLDKDELKRIGGEFDLPIDLVDKWAVNPKSALQHYRSYARLNLSTKTKPEGYMPAAWERAAAVGSALLFLGLTGFLLIRNEPFSDPNLVVISRIMLSLSVAILGASIPGFLHVGWKGKGLLIRAGGAIALFVLSFLLTPKVL